MTRLPPKDTPQPSTQALSVQALGLWRPSRVRRILTLAGLQPTLAPPRAGGLVGVWGHSPRAARGQWVADRFGAQLVRIEDAFLRSVLPGRAQGMWAGHADGPLGLLIDPSGGVHFDPKRPSALEQLLAEHPLHDPALLARARLAMARIAAAGISKYTLHLPEATLPEPGFVLVADQTAGDAAVRASDAGPETFRAMLAAACAEHPKARILIRVHPETALGLRAGHFGPADAGGRVSLCAAPVPIPALLQRATAVYTVSSHIGFEAIMVGHRPQLFGAPFYAGWGLCDERHAHPLPRRGRSLSPAQLFAAAILLAPVWYDPCRDRLAPLEAILDQIEAEARQWREDHAGHVTVGMRWWKRAHLQRHFGRQRPLRHAHSLPKALTTAATEGRGLLVWGDATKARQAAAQQAAAGSPPVIVRAVEEAALRSHGLGADLFPPMALVTDRTGLAHDPSAASDLEQLIASPCPPGGEARAQALIALLTRAALGKYNIGARDSLPPALSDPGVRRILVVGQVEDDASVLMGSGGVRTNAGLLRAARSAHPQARLIYKPHPDVEAGLRRGALPDSVLTDTGATALPGVAAATAIAHADEVWTLTSTLGFEALLRGVPVTCLGAPFYAGWGLTTDLGPIPARRLALPRPSLAALAHAVLIAYPRYLDPVTGLPCPAEVVAERLAVGQTARRGSLLGALALAQRALARQAWLWRG